jgi:uncharacterized cupin superfamily protein
MKYVRCYAREDGESHFEDAEIAILPGTVGRELVGISTRFAVKDMSFVEVKKEGEDVGWHTAPDRRFVIYLAGEAEQETSDGEIRHFKPGDIALFEDTTGKGHKSRNLSDRLLVMITLA